VAIRGPNRSYALALNREDNRGSSAAQQSNAAAPESANYAHGRSEIQRAATDMSNRRARNNSDRDNEIQPNAPKRPVPPGFNNK